MKHHLSILVAAAFMALSSPANARWIELTFDDGPDGSGINDAYTELESAEDIPAGTIRFVGGAHRSSITEGRYGRAAQLVGLGSAVEVALDDEPAFRTVYMWVQVDDPSEPAWLLDVAGIFGVRLVNGEVVVSYDTGSGFTDLGTALFFPTDGAFHLVVIELWPDDSPTSVDISISRQRARVGPVPLDDLTPTDPR